MFNLRKKLNEGGQQKDHCRPLLSYYYRPTPTLPYSTMATSASQLKALSAALASVESIAEELRAALGEVRALRPVAKATPAKGKAKAKARAVAAAVDSDEDAPAAKPKRAASAHAVFLKGLAPLAQPLIEAAKITNPGAVAAIKGLTLRLASAVRPHCAEEGESWTFVDKDGEEITLDGHRAPTTADISAALEELLDAVPADEVEAAETKLAAKPQPKAAKPKAAAAPASPPKPKAKPAPKTPAAPKKAAKAAAGGGGGGGGGGGENPFSDDEA